MGEREDMMQQNSAMVRRLYQQLLAWEKDVDDDAKVAGLARQPVLRVWRELCMAQPSTMTRTHLAILILCLVTPACDSAVPVGPALPTAPTLLATNPNYTGEWRGGWRVINCTDQPPRLGYCASNSRPDFEPARLVLTQSTGTITGRMQARIGDGPITGRVDELGRLRLQGTLPSVPSRFPVTRITDWRSVINPADGSLVTGFTIDHLWGTDLSLAARSVNEMVIPFCPRPSTVGFFWEC